MAFFIPVRNNYYIMLEGTPEEILERREYARQHQQRYKILSEAEQESYLRWIRRGYSPERACKQISVSVNSVRETRKKFPEFERAIKEIRSAQCVEVENEVVKMTLDQSQTIKRTYKFPGRDGCGAKWRQCRSRRVLHQKGVPDPTFLLGGRPVLASRWSCRCWKWLDSHPGRNSGQGRTGNVPVGLLRAVRSSSA